MPAGTRGRALRGSGPCVRSGPARVTGSAGVSPPSETGVPDMSGSYDLYISSGLYDRRYPRPNQRMLRLSLACLPAGGRFLDFGAGTGRYTAPLLALTRADGIAYDISPTACRALSERLEPFARDGRLAVRSGAAEALASDFPRAFDLVLMAFGVLGHVAGRAERMRLLRLLRGTLKAEGALVLSLPNARRRFRTERRASAPLVAGGRLEPGDVLYKRGQGADSIRMFYHLYTLAEARRDLAEAGYRTERVEAESLLAEETVVKSRLVGRLDALACRLAPASCGYGILAVCRPGPA